MTTGKTIALTRQTFVDKVMSLLFNMPSKLILSFVPKSMYLLISWLQSPSAVILEPQKINSATVPTVSPSNFPWSDGTRCHDLTFLNGDFQDNVFTLLFQFLKMLFSSSSLSAIKVMSPTYLRLFIFLPAILIPACASSSPAFLMIYSAYKSNKQGENIHFDILFCWFGTSLLFHVQLEHV